MTDNSSDKNFFNGEQSPSYSHFSCDNNSVAIIGLRSFSFLISKGLLDFKWIAIVDIFAIGFEDE